MTDDIIKNARGELKRAAARVLARREEAEQKLATLTPRRDQLSRDRQLAVDAGQADLIADIDRTLGSLSEQIGHLEEQHAQSKSTFTEIQEELEQLGRLEANTRIDTVRNTADEVITGGDPFDPTAEDVALQNARNAILELEAQLEVARELNPNPQVDRDTERRLRELETAKAKAKAQETLKKLKEERKGKTEGKKKRTL